MDDRFADRMAELSEISDALLEQRWSTVEQIAADIDEDTKVRLVLIACGVALDRDADEWFWRPFRENEPTFRIDDGTELHIRLAEAATRYLIVDHQDFVTAMLVRLAMNAGHDPRTQDLVEVAAARLLETEVAIPKVAQTKAFFTEETKQTLQASPADAANLEAIVSGAQAAVVALTRQANALARWATFANARYTSDQRLIEWLLNGVRSDGTAWSALSAGAAAVDAARELADLIVSAPQPRHEAILQQVLAVAGHDDVAIKRAAKDIQPFSDPPPAALQPIAPILDALAAGGSIPKRKPTELAIRTLWEARAVTTWNRAQ